MSGSKSNRIGDLTAAIKQPEQILGFVSVLSAGGANYKLKPKYETNICCLRLVGYGRVFFL